MAALRLLSLPGVFQPHCDTLMLAEYLRREPRVAGARVLDPCTGSGLLAVVAGQVGAATVTAVDVSRRSLLLTRANARLNGVRVPALRGDLFSAVSERRFDLIITNPPYVPSPADARPRHRSSRAWEAGPRGRAFIDPIWAQAAEHLSPGGVLLLIQSSVCDERSTVAALRSTGLRTSIAERQRGPLGRRLEARAAWLRRQGMLDDANSEELVIIRAEMPHGPVDCPGSG